MLFGEQRTVLRMLGERACVAGALALAIAAYLFGGRMALAADLGGDCCADLEQRVAELESAAVRKTGKVSVTISGYVTKQVFAWDDGVEQNLYVTDIGPTQATNFRINGQATIAPGWTAGYMIRVQDLEDNTVRLNQFNDNDNQGLNVQMSNWYLASTDYGKLTLGKQAMASKSVAMYTDLSGTQLIANYVLFDGPGFFLRQDKELLRIRWGDIAYCYSQARPWGGDCDGIVMEGVRYDSPTFAGASWSASYGEDDDWEVAGRYTARRPVSRSRSGWAIQSTPTRTRNRRACRSGRIPASSKSAVMPSISRPDCSCMATMAARTTTARPSSAASPSRTAINGT